MSVSATVVPSQDSVHVAALAVSATALVMAFSYHALPVTELITPGSPIAYLFGSESSFFWWLLARFS